MKQITNFKDYLNAKNSFGGISMDEVINKYDIDKETALLFEIGAEAIYQDYPVERIFKNIEPVYLFCICNHCRFKTEILPERELYYTISIMGGYISNMGNGTYEGKCPKCGKNTLDFAHKDLYDLL